MARLIPDFVSEECKSSAERRLFTRFKEELPDGFTVLHSLGVARHRYKLYSEADFVLICAQAVIVFEVKGGRIKRKDGCWFFTDRYGQLHKRRESPMQQAGSVTAALRNSVGEHFGWTSPQVRTAFGSVSFFPDIEFSEPSPEWDLRRVYDIDTWRRPVNEFVTDAIQYSCDEAARLTNHKPSVLTAEQVASLVQFMRGDFEKLPSLSVTLDGLDQQMIRLAERQCAILDALARNRRMVIEGSAGTGKTLLAMEVARRNAAQGRRVLFVCFNRLLADHLDVYAGRNRLSTGISIDTLHGHCLSVIRAAEISIARDISERELYQDHIPLQIPAALGQLKDFKPWDILVVDEGQDLAAHAPFVDALNLLFEGGFAKGRWIWFEDPRQRILRQQGRDAFDLASYEPSYFALTRNCRNTNEVATFTCVCTMIPLPELSGIQGPQVHTTVCEGATELAELQTLVSEILQQGARPEHIVLLTAGSEQDASFIRAGQVAGRNVVRYDSRRPAQPDSIRYSSVFRFKGLESKIIILTDMHDLRSEAGRMAAYVGMSRANSALFILLSPDAKAQMEENRLSFCDVVEDVRSAASTSAQ